MPPEQTDETTPSRGPSRRNVLRGLAAGGTLALSTALADRAAAHDLEVRFRGCTEVWIVVNDPDEFGVLQETIHVFDAESGEVRTVAVELTPENTRPIPNQFGDRPVFVARARGNDAILAVETGDGRVFENPNDCPPEEPAPTEQFVVRQGGECAPIAPLSYQDQPVEAFYGYNPDPTADNSQQTNFPVPLEAVQTSRLFLYRGPNGLSLVFVHGGEDDPGGAASFALSGAPGGASWLVQDDGATDQFAVGGGTATADWAWGAMGRNDGGALGFLGGNFAIQIDPRFNEQAELGPFDGPEAVVQQWQVLSGDATDPDVIGLALDQPVEIATGTC
jgi:hypothetical protein